VRSALAVVLVVVVLSAPAVADAGPVSTPGAASIPDPAADEQTPGATTGDPSLVAVYPNPVAAGDKGEFVVVSVPPGTDLGTLAIGDDEGRVPLPNGTASRRVTLSTHPNLTRELLERRVRPLPDSLELANAGEPLRLYRNGSVLDSFAYENAPEGEVRVRDGRREWRPLGATDREVVTAEGGRVTAFALPDAPTLAVEHLRGADRRILLAGYTLTSRPVADALVAAARRGVTVRVLVDGDPVGGMTARQARLLDRLDSAGVAVRVLGGDRARYRFHHAKYAVVDDRALVTTENWKPAGIGGRGSRGWGVVTDQLSIVEGLVETFRADAGWQDARHWGDVREGRTFAEAERANGTYPSRFDPARVPVERTRLLVAPDNAGPEIRSVLAGAEESLVVQQVTLGSREQPFVRETLAATRRGVRVRILLSSAWYVREDNERLAAWLNDRADAEGLPLEARVADPRGRFEKIHAKGAVVDGERVILGSLNWNNNSVRENREVVLVLEGQEVGVYYRRVFEADWDSGGRRLPAGLAVALIVVGSVAMLVASRIEFERGE